MKKISVILSMVLIFTFLFSIAPQQANAKGFSGIEDAFNDASSYFKANYYIGRNDITLNLGMKTEVIEKMISLIPQIQINDSGTGWRTKVYINKLRVDTISESELVLNADMRVKYYRVVLGKKIKISDKNGTCKVKLKIKAKNNDIVIDSSRVYDINIDFNILDYITGGVLGTVIADKIIQEIKIRDGEDKALIPLSKIVPTKYAALKSISTRNGFMWFGFDVDLKDELKLINKLSDTGMPFTQSIGY